MLIGVPGCSEHAAKSQSARWPFGYMRGAVASRRKPVASPVASRKAISPFFRWQQNRLAIYPRSVRKNSSRPLIGMSEPALLWQAVPLFWDHLRLSRASKASNLSLQSIIFTASRSNEVRGACWSEIDLAAREWTVPASQMKMKR
jgi:integrase